MPWTIDSALAKPEITVLERDDALGMYEILVGALKTPVTVKLCRSPTSQATRYEMSHAMHTPVQAGPYIQSRVFWDDPPYALHQAVDSLTGYYADAVKAGYRPKETWLKARSPAQI